MNNLKQSEVADPRARLTTAEQERDSYRDGEKAANEALERNIKRARAAEARVEAATRYANAACAMLYMTANDPSYEQIEQDFIDARNAHIVLSSRAALACPPQQRGEK